MPLIPLEESVQAAALLPGRRSVQACVLLGAMVLCWNRVWHGGPVFA